MPIVLEEQVDLFAVEKKMRPYMIGAKGLKSLSTYYATQTLGYRCRV